MVWCRRDVPVGVPLDLSRDSFVMLHVQMGFFEEMDFAPHCVSFYL